MRTILLFIFTLILISCGRDTETIHGNWTTNKFNASAVHGVIEIPLSEFKETTAYLPTKFNIRFDKDQTFNLSCPGLKTIHGTWQRQLDSIFFLQENVPWLAFSEVNFDSDSLVLNLATARIIDIRKDSLTVFTGDRVKIILTKLNDR